MSFLFTAAGWLIALACTEVTVSHAVRAAVPRLRRGLPGGYWPSALLYGAASAVAFTFLGVLPAVLGVLLAVALFAADAWYLLEPWVRAVTRGQGHVVGGRRILAAAVRQARGGPQCLLADLRALLRTLRRGDSAGDDEAPPATAPAPGWPGASRAVPAPREAPPSVRDDPALGVPPAPADVAAGLAAAGAPVPLQWAALCDATASFEPDSDEALLEHAAGEAAGILAYAEARRSLADTLLHGTGLDPAYVAGHHEFADEFAELAAAVALVDRRFHAIYGAIREWVAGGGILPNNAREWLGGGGAAPQQDAGAGDDVAA